MKRLQVFRDVGVGLAAQLGLALKGLGRVELVHHELDELDRLRRGERRVLEQRGELLLRRDRVRPGVLALLAAERVEQLCPFPADGRG